MVTHKVLDMGKGCNQRGTSKRFMHCSQYVDMCLHHCHYKPMFHVFRITNYHFSSLDIIGLGELNIIIDACSLIICSLMKS